MRKQSQSYETASRGSLVHQPQPSRSVPTSTVSFRAAKAPASSTRAQETGALVCDFAQGTHTLLVSAETNDALVRCLDIVIDPVRTFTGTMRMPAGKTKLLIGSEGKTITRLRQQSGCRTEPGNDTWKLHGRTRESIEAFVRLADEEVPGCVLEVVQFVEPPVRDIFGDVVPGDWRAHVFPRGDTALAKSVDDEPVVDMRPTAAANAATADVDGATHEVRNGPVTRFAKVSETGAMIVEVDLQNLKFNEYDPFAPDDRWSGEVSVIDDESLKLMVRGHELIVKRTGPAVFEGVETGSSGGQAFVVVHLSNERSDLDWRDRSSWVAFARRAQDQKRRTEGGVALISVEDAEDESIVAKGLYDALSWRAARRALSPHSGDDAGALELEVNGWVEGQRITSMSLIRDADSSCYRSTELFLYPISSGNAITELGWRPKRRRRRRRNRSETDLPSGDVADATPDGLPD